MIETVYHTPTDLPSNPPDGVYVIVDVWNFSMTVLTLLGNGAETVHVAESPDDALRFKDEHDGAIAATEPEPDGGIPDGFDFCNSPYEARQIDAKDTPVSIYADNSARTISRLREASTTLYTGATLNARILGQHLRDNEDGVRIISAGFHGRRAVEDTIATSMISRYIHTDELSEVETTVYRDGLNNCEAGTAAMNGSRRMRNDYTLAHEFNSLPVVPKLDGDGFVDVSVGNTPHMSTSPGNELTE